ncbi:unnamed protein product [Chondrus crispus]|uniref:Uncharacterized protein n=1 Tax=Chondrus crispus TaxID=2769 RepID=R7QML8_CHOCR|nr:unnamed protein product [Chondrus crispus]CDF38731.1 unnamed protein product [Chondrus crispus]|eukprot:XP_005718636.1 unnamed protein product [Chondrus crispus]
MGGGVHWPAPLPPPQRSQRSSPVKATPPHGNLRPRLCQPPSLYCPRKSSRARFSHTVPHIPYFRRPTFHHGFAKAHCRFFDKDRARPAHTVRLHTRPKELQGHHQCPPRNRGQYGGA